MASKGGRRPNGDGYIGLHTASGRYTAKATVTDAAGNTSRRTIYGATAAEVREKLTAINRERDRGMVAPEGQMTVKQYLTEWLEQKRPKVREGTWVGYEYIVRVHLIPGLGKHKLKALSQHQVEAFYSAKLKTDLSPTTVRRMHDVLHNALRAATRKELVARNVTELVDAPREAERTERYYSVEQVATLLGALEGHRLEALIILALTTGMRQGELLALRWRDVDMTCGTLQVRQNRTRLVRGYTDGKPKTRESEATLILAPTAIEALRRQRARVKAMRLRAGDRWQEHEIIFPSANGTHLLGPNLRKYWQRLTARAGLPYIHFHDLRHSAGTLLTESGVGIKQVSGALRHKRIETTANRYLHTTPTMQADTALAMERIMQRAMALRTGHTEEEASATGTADGLPNKD